MLIQRVFRFEAGKTLCTAQCLCLEVRPLYGNCLSLPRSSGDVHAALGTRGRRLMETGAVKFQGQVYRAAQPAWGRAVWELGRQVTQVSDAVPCERSPAGPPCSQELRQHSLKSKFSRVEAPSSTGVFKLCLARVHQNSH